MESLKNKIPQRKIGETSVPALGFGAMNMSAFYKHNDTPEVAEKQNLELLTFAADNGETHWDTSDVYGPHTNEELIGRWFKLTGRRKEIFLATKFGGVHDKEKRPSARGDVEYVRQCIEGSLKRLGTDYVDLFYIHRIDKNTRIEDTVGELAKLVKEGKIRNIGLSECSANTLRRAYKVHPIAAVQIEYSIFCLDIEREEIGLKKACDELGVTVVAYSPLGRGLLSGQLRSRKDLLEGDVRLVFPRFSEENFPKNLELVDKIVNLAKKKGCTPSQLALAWLLRQGDNVIPIPGTRQVKNLQENLGTYDVVLNDEDVKEIRSLAENAEIFGSRYPKMMSDMLFGDTI